MNNGLRVDTHGVLGGRGNRELAGYQILPEWWAAVMRWVAESGGGEVQVLKQQQKPLDMDDSEGSSYQSISGGIGGTCGS